MKNVYIKYSLIILAGISILTGGIFFAIRHHNADERTEIAVKPDVPNLPVTNILQSNKDNSNKMIQDSDDLEKVNINEFLHDHLANRYHCDAQNWYDIVNNNYKNVTVLENNTFQYDYGVNHQNGKIILRAKNRKTTEWLVEQYIKYLSYTDTCINTSDLPPSVVNFEKSEDKDFDFTYREPHFSPNLKAKYDPYYGANSVEEYWDLWGHNLYKELKIYKKQQVICFSDETFFNNVVKYLESKSRTLHTGRFMIMPMDVMSACTCSKCRELGNSANYATPALMNMLDRLAEKFSKIETLPKYSFYTAAYHSTQLPPKTPPKYRTAGLILSTSDLPKGVALDTKNVSVVDFMETIQAWKDYTDELLVWDYAANFNDYLTPLPILYVLKKNLKFFRDCGITGIFLQGGSYDYSTFDDVKTFAAMALMIDNRLDVDDLCTRFFKQYYPVSAQLLINYYLSLEKAMEAREQEYDMHGNLDNAIKSYFSVSNFLVFYQNLETFIKEKKMGDHERKQLEKLYSALSFTRLQIALYQQTLSYDISKTHGKTIKITPEIETAIKWLSKHSQYNFDNYKERDGNLNKYLDFWGKYTKK